MNSHEDFGNMGTYPDLVSHEFGHQFGLSDKGGTYYKAGGIMEYSGTNLNKISTDDVKQIIEYTKAYLAKPADFSNSAKVKVFEEKGAKDTNNPIGIK